MSSPDENDPQLARFRRGAGRRVGPPGPPPAVPQYVARPEGEWSVPTDGVAQVTSASSPYAPPPVPQAPIAAGTVPPAPGGQDPAHPLFGDLVGAPSAAPAEPLYAEPSYEWMAASDDDPGKPTGIVSIVLGLFVGIIGLFVGIYSIRRSREAGLSGGRGIAGVIVSLLSILLVGSIGLSWLRYGVEVAEQCSLVGPGTYLTQSGSEVTCR